MSMFGLEREAKLRKLQEDAFAWYDALTPEQKREHDEAQRKSYIRGMMPAGHGMTRAQIEERLAIVERQIAEATCWGAALSELGEERDALRAACCTEMNHAYPVDTHSATSRSGGRRSLGMATSIGSAGGQSDSVWSVDICRRAASVAAFVKLRVYNGDTRIDSGHGSQFSPGTLLRAGERGNVDAGAIYNSVSDSDCVAGAPLPLALGTCHGLS